MDKKHPALQPNFDMSRVKGPWFQIARKKGAPVGDPKDKNIVINYEIIDESHMVGHLNLIDKKGKP